MLYSYFQRYNFYEKRFAQYQKNFYFCSPLLDVAQLVAHLVRDQEVAGSSPVIQTKVKIKHLRIFESA